MVRLVDAVVMVMVTVTVWQGVWSQATELPFSLTHSPVNLQPSIPVLLTPRVPSATHRNPRHRSLAHTGQPFSQRSPLSQTNDRRRHYTRAESSSSLSHRSVEGMLDVMSGEEWWGLGPATSHQGSNAVLASDFYQGKRTLVYKLAPGTHVISGVKTKYAIDNNTDGDFKTKYNGDMNRRAFKNNPSAKKGNVSIYIRSKSGTSHHRGNILRDNLRRNQVVDRNREWDVHYMQPPPPLSAMHNPYLTTLRHGSKHKKHSAGRYGKMSGKNAADLLLRPFAYGMRKTRGGVRSAWVSFLLLHYLGFLPEFPGVPRHRDPARLQPSTSNTIQRRPPHKHATRPLGILDF